MKLRAWWNQILGKPATFPPSTHAHAHADTTGQTTDDHHSESHTVVSHSDTTATGAELETLTDGSDGDSLHTHASKLSVADIDDTPVNGETAQPISSNWAFDHDADGDAHHNESHTVASHSDTTATGAQLNTLVGGSDASSLHYHLAQILCYKNAAAQDLDGTNVAVNWGSAVHGVLGSAISWSAGNPSRVTINANGWYLISCDVYGESITQRANITLQIRKDGSTFIGPKAASGYIRALSGHNESSVHIGGFSAYLTSGTYIEAVANTAAAAGSWNTVIDTSTIFVTQLQAA